MNTLSTYSERDKYFQSQYDIVLRNALIAEKVCKVDNTDLKRIQNPYGSQPTATIQAVAGTYSVSDRKSTLLNSSHIPLSRMPSSA